MTTTRIQPDPIVVHRQNDLFDLWHEFADAHADEPGWGVERAKGVRAAVTAGVAPSQRAAPAPAFSSAWGTPFSMKQ